MNITLAGFSSSGKTTLFSSFLGSQGKGGSKNGIGIVSIPDPRLDSLSRHYNPKKTTYAAVDFKDTAPLDTPVKQERIALFDTLKVSDCLVYVMGAYRWSEPGEVLKELGRMRLEIIIHDLDFVVKRTERIMKDLKSSHGDQMKEKELALLGKIQPLLESEQFLNGLDIDQQERAFLTDYGLLSRKPSCYIMNVSESMDEDMIKELVEGAVKSLRNAGDSSPVLSVDAKLENEIAMLSPQEREKFLEGFGISESGRDKVIRTAYEMLNLITFFTVGEDECRSWKIRCGSTAIDAAGAIHSDLARGFIRAEVIEHDILLELGSLNEAKKCGKLRLEGKTYLVKDGEIVHIMFNV